jgi:hypothetical protein
MTYEQGSGFWSLASHVERFVQERRCLEGVSPATGQWYKYSFKAFESVLSERYQSTTDFKGPVMRRIGEHRGADDRGQGEQGRFHQHLPAVSEDFSQLAF